MKFHRLLSLILCAMLLLGALPGKGHAEDAITWSLEGGALSISGSGQMQFSKIPWQDHLEEIQTVRMDEGIVSLQDGAFAGCTGLRSVTLPKNLRYIGSGAFEGCTSLSWITFPTGLVGIGERAFAGCTKLTSAFVPNSVSWIADRAFEPTILLNGRKDSAAADYIGDNGGSFRQSDYHEFAKDSGSWGQIGWILDSGKLTVTGTGAVAGKTMADFPWESYRADITTLEVGEGITKIDALAFKLCRKLTQVTLPASVTEIAEGAFRPDAVISAPSGSIAESYAAAQKLEFISLGETDAQAAEETQATEVTEATEETQAAQATEAAETAEETQATESTEATEATEGTQATETGEETQPTEETAATEETVATEETEPQDSTVPEPHLSLGSATAQPGQTVKLPVTLSNNPGLCGMSFAISYDKTYLTLEDYDCTGDILTPGDWTVGIGEGEKALWLQSDQTDANGEILTLVFRLADNAPQGAISVTLTDCLAVDGEGSPCTLTLEAGTVTVASGILGDVNGDGRVTAADAKRLRRFLSGQSVTIENGNADLNADGTVNIFDLLLLQKLVGKE